VGHKLFNKKKKSRVHLPFNTSITCKLLLFLERCDRNNILNKLLMITGIVHNKQYPTIARTSTSPLSTHVPPPLSPMAGGTQTRLAVAPASPPTPQCAIAVSPGWTGGTATQPLECFGGDESPQEVRIRLDFCIK
jgi:hypothetical protein